MSRKLDSHKEKRPGGGNRQGVEQYQTTQE